MVFHDSVVVNEGDVLTLGRGSDTRTGDFVFIYRPANAFIGSPLQYYPNIYSNTQVKVKFFKEYSTAKTGRKIFTVIDAPGYNMVAEISPAIETGEIIAVNGKSVVKKTDENKGGSITSTADELLKLKKLLDDSLITRDEFDIQKRKLLDEK